MSNRLKRNITLDEWQVDWLDEHQDFNFSAQVRVWLQNYIDAFEG
jgi:hypothetical protein